MSDRTNVYITAPAWADKAITEDLYDEKIVNDDGTVTYEINECNYGESELEERLDTLGVGYDKSWSPGENYLGGKSWVRYQGQVRHLVTITEEDKLALADIVIGSLLDGRTNEIVGRRAQRFVQRREIVQATEEVKDILPPANWEQRFPPRIESPPEDFRKRAEAAMKGWCAAAGVKLEDTDPIERMTDFLTDLLHLAVYQGVTIEELLRTAENHFNEEKNHG